MRISQSLVGGAFGLTDLDRVSQRDYGFITISLEVINECALFYYVNAAIG